MRTLDADAALSVARELPGHALSDRAAKAMKSPEFRAAMKGYHDLVDHGRREIYSIEK